MSRTLLGLFYSPWTIRARFALAHHGVDYDFEHYTPTIDVLKTRWRTGNWNSKVTVPILFEDGQRPLLDSVDIAKHADTMGDGSLFADSKVSEWIEKANVAMSAGRMRSVQNTLKEPEAIKELLPKGVPGWMSPVARRTMRGLVSKYPMSNPNALSAFLHEVRKAKGDGDTILSSLSFADMAAVAAIEFVSPVSNEWVRRGPSSRRLWSDESLIREFDDLLSWRDAFFEQHPPWRRKS